MDAHTVSWKAIHMVEFPFINFDFYILHHISDLYIHSEYLFIKKDIPNINMLIDIERSQV